MREGVGGAREFEAAEGDDGALGDVGVGIIEAVQEVGEKVGGGDVV